MRKMFFWLPVGAALFGLLGPVGTAIITGQWDIMRLFWGPLAWAVIGLCLALLLGAVYAVIWSIKYLLRKLGWLPSSPSVLGP